MRYLQQTEEISEPSCIEQLQRTVAQLTAEVRKLRSENARLKRVAATDPLTGIGNRAAFRSRLGEAIRIAQEKKRFDLSLMLLDVDHFKLVNDRHGHQMGDTVLKKVARILREAIRESDFLARYGGEEFVVLLPATDRKGAITIAERLRKKIARGPWPTWNVTISIGVSTLHPAAPNARRLIRDADRALYRAKTSGRNRVND